MNKIYIMALLTIAMVFTSVQSFAQMGHGMMRDGHMMGQEGHMMDDREGRRQNEQMMQHRHMMNSMMGMTQDVAIMMRQMSVIMGNVSDPDSTVSKERMNRMSGLMKEMAASMNRISDMMAKGTASEEQVRIMQRRINDMREQMWQLKR